MKRTIPVVLAVLALAACDDEQTKPVTVPTAPSSFAPMTAQASAQAAGISGGSTICRVYVTERDVAKIALDAAPSDTLQQRRVQMLDALVKETCN